MRLVRNSNAQTLVPRLELAGTFWARTKGLLGRRELQADGGLWILHCNSVHTFFMHFAIDLIFLSGAMEVTKTLARVRPGRVVLPVWRATSVIELPEGFLAKNPIRVGEKLNVDPALS